MWDFARGPASCGPVEAGLAAGKLYADEVAKQGRKHGLGMPHPHVCLAVCEKMRDSAKTQGKHNDVLNNN